MAEVKVKKEKGVLDPAEVEKRIKELCEQFPQGITDHVIQNDMPHLEPQQRAGAINRLLSLGQLDLLRNSSGLLYRLKDTQGSRALVEKGVRSRDIRFKSNLPLTEINKILKNLESKKLIKAVKSVAVSLNSCRCSRANTLNVLRVLLLLSKIFGSTRLGPGPCLTVEVRVSQVDLSMEDIETILNTLIYDGKVEMTVIVAKEGTAGSVDGQMKLYRGVNSITAPTGLVKTPCGLCPVFDDCHDGGEISPSTCIYLSEWLDF
uniref:DNA-directed RNA polymerase III subunit RPC6 n=1 Tax=Periophthalmus magnuspinnatus TaxID=409849 RepID=A0A3B4AZX6_9GOBI